MKLPPLLKGAALLRFILVNKIWQPSALKYDVGSGLRSLDTPFAVSCTFNQSAMRKYTAPRLPMHRGSLSFLFWVHASHFGCMEVNTISDASFMHHQSTSVISRLHKLRPWSLKRRVLFLYSELGSSDIYELLDFISSVRHPRIRQGYYSPWIVQSSLSELFDNPLRCWLTWQRAISKLSMTFRISLPQTSPRLLANQ